MDIHLQKLTLMICRTHLTTPSSSVTRYVCDHARCYHSSDVCLRVSHLTQLVGVEESCAEAVELAELLLTLGELEHYSLSCSAKPF